MLDKETGVMKQMLEDAGIEVVVATTTGGPMTSGDFVLEADLKIADAKASDYDGFILPCMAPASGSPLPDEVVALIEEANKSGKPIAASRGSVAILGEAGAYLPLASKWSERDRIRRVDAYGSLVRQESVSAD